jgi:bla regulator protein blaR1
MLADLAHAIHSGDGPDVVVVTAPLPSQSGPDLLQFAGYVWMFGVLCILGHWMFRWIRVAAILRSSSPAPLRFPIPVRTSASLIEPGVFGIFRPVLLLPEGISDRLAPDELDAILTHEASHVRRRDNLTAFFHMLIEAAFWFHPLIWWIGARLIDERERACDEDVVSHGIQPQVYAAGVLAVCRFYVESPLACLPGAAGANLKRRIEAILGGKPALPLTFAKRAAIAAAASVTVLTPLIVGIWNAPPLRAQSQGAASAPSAAKFEVASVKPSSQPRMPLQDAARFASQAGKGPIPLHGSIRMSFPLKELIMVAYEVKDLQVLGGPSWTGSEFYEVIAKAENPNANLAQLRVMLQTLLADRFQLRLRRDTREMPIYELQPAKSGLKIESSKPGTCNAFDPNAPRPRLDPQHPAPHPNLCGGFWISVASGLPDFKWRFEGLPIAMPTLIDLLIHETGRMIADKTGFTDRFDFRLDFAPDPSGGSWPGPPGAASLPGVSIFTALQQQLGLRLEAAKGPVDVLVIDHVERPSAN